MQGPLAYIAENLKPEAYKKNAKNEKCGWKKNCHTRHCESSVTSRESLPGTMPSPNPGACDLVSEALNLLET